MESRFLLLYKSLELGFKCVDISQVDSYVLSWIIFWDYQIWSLPLMPPKIYSYYLTGHITTVQYNYITIGNLTTGHMSEEKQKSVYNCEIQE